MEKKYIIIATIIISIIAFYIIQRIYMAIKSYFNLSKDNKCHSTLVRRINDFIICNGITASYNITLNDVPNLKLYLEGRVVDQIDWYEHGCNINKNKYLFVRINTLILSAIIPLLVLLNEVFCIDLKYVTAISAILAATITILNGWNEIALLQSKYIEFRLVTEKLKKELALFLTSADHYNITIENTDKSKLKEAYNSLIKTPEDYIYISFNAEQMIEAIRIIQFKEFVSRVEAIINSDCYKWSESITKKK